MKINQFNFDEIQLLQSVSNGYPKIMQVAYSSFLMKFTNIDQKTLANEALELYQAICQTISIVEDLQLRHLNDEYQ